MRTFPFSGYGHHLYLTELCLPAGIADFAPEHLENGMFGGKPKFTSFQEVVDRAAMWVKQSHVSIPLYYVRIVHLPGI